MLQRINSEEVGTEECLYAVDIMPLFFFLPFHCC